MILLDRVILLRFLGSFLLLFAIFFVLAVTLDVVLQIDEFVDVAKEAVAAGRFESLPGAVVVAILDFHGPRLFQFFGFMVGLVSVAAAGFTLSSMVKHRELVAITSAGIGLVRVGLVILAGAFALNVLALVNGELVLPRLAPMLLRKHDAILARGLREYEVPLTRDADNALLRATRFVEPLMLRRDEAGRAVERISAISATWDEAAGAWILEGGEAIEVRPAGEASPAADRVVRTSRPVDRFETDLSPTSLLVRRSAEYAQLLGLVEIQRLREGAGPQGDVLARTYYGRFAQVAVNLLVLATVLPCFLLRAPRPLLAQSAKTAAIAVPGILGSIAIMTVELPGLPPALSSFLPAALLLPIAAARLAWLRS
jgi:lipopolysaccharide export LptBFGC system permease protein LptF